MTDKIKQRLEAEARRQRERDISFDNFRNFYMSKTREVFENYDFDNQNSKREFDFIKIDNALNLQVIPEPLTFIDEFASVKDFESCEKIFLKIKEERSKSIKYKGEESDLKDFTGFWNNSTSSGINLRPGFNKKDKRELSRVVLGDNSVHALVAGRTGAGKSVFVNNLLMNLLYEYPSWELDLYLIDFKKVEFSRYLSKVNTPHICAVAATEEVRYVVSMLEYLNRAMLARETLFSKIGETKISDFREKYNVVLPRILLVVDEFQQMFLEATAKENAKISEYLTAITKKGRATGVHLIFSSQEMSGTLSSSVKTNFKARFALPASAEVSTDILGNKEASVLEPYHVLSNDQGGNSEYNEKYAVPFIKVKSDTEDQKSEFDLKLKKLVDLENKFTFSKIHKFYEEQETKEFSVIKSIKEEPNIKNAIKNITQGTQYIDNIILGPSVTFNQNHNDIESLFLERGKNKNIGLFSTQLSNCAYFTRLIFDNFLYSEKNYKFIVVNRNRAILEQAQLEHVYNKMNNGNHLGYSEETSDEAIDELIESYESRIQIQNIIEQSSSIEEYLKNLIPVVKDMLPKNMGSVVESEIKILIKEVKQGTNSIDYDQLRTKMLSSDIPWICGMYESLVTLYYKYDVEKIKIEELFPFRLVFILGADNMPLQLKRLKKNVEKSTQYNYLFIFSTTSIDEASLLEIYKRNSHYLFAYQANEKTLLSLKINVTKKAQDNIAIDGKIAHLDKDLSFKKLNLKLSEIEFPKLDLDALLP